MIDYVQPGLSEFSNPLCTFCHQVIEAELHSTVKWDLTEEGKQVTTHGSHEAQVYNAIPPSGSTQTEIMVSQFKVIILKVFKHDFM